MVALALINRAPRIGECLVFRFGGANPFLSALASEVCPLPCSSLPSFLPLP